ncbi:MAG: hypothetical protein KF774_07245 [Planctomyces sp.]|nr:hypothetical protein [Planctomyces sp.]
MRLAFSCVAGCVLVLAFAASAQAQPLIQVQQNFSNDPGWDHYQNRIRGVDMPQIRQDFGWRPTNHTGAGPGEISGRVENSRRQAYYAMPLGRPFTFDDELSASGRLALHHIGLRGVGYIGFFNSQRHTWRVWSSMAFRIWEEDDLGQVMFDWMSSDWQARGAETAILLQPDGATHAWSFRYEPDVRADPVWRDELLERHVTSRTGNSAPYDLQGEEHLLERMRAEEPGLTAEALHRRLLAARDQGLLEYFHRHDQHRWWKRPDAGQGHGRVTLTFEGHDPYVFWFDQEIRRAPAEFDRFGLFNIARFGTRVELSLSDLTVNGERIELNQDPGWEGRNNASSYEEPNFHGAHSYGWSQTNWAGERPGEIGGLFWRTEPQDPLFSYYGDDVGELTLDDPISFSGSICFTDGMTDAAAYFGYFNSDNQVETFERDQPDAGFPMRNMLGVTLADSSAVGYYFTPLASASNREGSGASCGVFTPDRRRRQFSFVYDPQAADGLGEVTVTLDGVPTRFALTRQQREAGAVFNRFGLANVRRGGHSVEFYLDDLNYTARRDESALPSRRDQTTVEVPYPHKSAGRSY